MKKKIFSILFVLVLAASLMLVPAAVLAHTATSPFTTGLIADGGSEGTAINVGDVSVWNDGTNLYIKYTTTDGWELTQTHLAVADNSSDIPQTKTGNPKPGQFANKTKHDPTVQTHTYTIPLAGLNGSDLYIAAHAKVEKLGDVMTATLVTGANTDQVLVIAENTTDPGYPGPYSDTPTPSVVIEGTANGYSGWPTITGAQWISDSIAEPSNVNEWRLFTRSFDIPSGAINISGTLHIDSDNAEEVKINGDPGTPPMVYGEVYGTPTDDGEWERVQHWPVDLYLQPGPNTLEVMVRNYYWLNMPGGWRNYTGLVYKMDYEYQLLRTETAWGAGERFTDKGNWATYFTYTVQEVLDLRANPPYKDVPAQTEPVAGFVILNSATGAVVVDVSLEEGISNRTYGVYLEDYYGQTGPWKAWTRLGYLTTNGDGDGHFSTTLSRSSGIYYLQVVLSLDGSWGPLAFGTDIAQVIIQ